MNQVDLLDRRVATAFYGGFSSVRPSQADVIEPLVNGRNVVLTSGTGSGKTEAVVAPIISRYWIDALTNNELFLIYISPTKALVNDLEKRLRNPLSSLGLRIGIRHSDRDDLTRLQPPHILITTPESLDVLLFRKELCIYSVRAIIIDEVHILYNTQRGLQLSILLHRLQGLCEKQIQWAALSATIGDVSFVRDFLMGSEVQADFFSYPSERRVDCHIRNIKNLNEFRQLIERLMIESNYKLLVFADSRKECERIASSLSQSDILSKRVLVHYSSLSQQVRAETEEKFASLSSAICIATSTLELGIDIGDIDAVVIWGVPNSVEAFMQRIGRGNRRSKKVNVICLVPDTSKTLLLDLLKFCVLIECSINGDVPQRDPYELYGAIAQQCLGEIASNEGKFIKTADLHQNIKHLSYVDRDALESLLSGLAEKEFIRKHDYKYRYAAYEKLFQIVDLRLIYGNFSLGSKMVRLQHGAKNLGEVPEINLLRIHKGNLVRFQGKYWIVKKITPDSITLDTTGNKGNPTDFIYPGSKLSVDPYILDRVWRIFNNDSDCFQFFDSRLRPYVEKMHKTVHDTMHLMSIPYIKYIGGIRYYTFGGRIVNRAIALMTGHFVETTDISLTLSSPISWETIPDNPLDYDRIFPKLNDKATSQSIFQMQLPLNMQLHEYLQCWLKDKSVAEILNRLKRSTPIEINRELAEKLGFDVDIEQ
ncbi:MAG: DEAD/DEAH box helicase [Candidatus Celaenobacter polaris]|nr:DEAD/DEAH box helicase [Candidatus Celaenobacter polaris]